MRRTGKLTAVLASAALALTLVACGSDAATEDPDTLSEDVAAALDVDLDAGAEVINACAKYFAFDLKMSEVKASSEARKKKKRDLLAEMKGLSDEMVLASEEAYISGDLPERVLTNANRIQKTLGRVANKDGIDGISRQQMNRINTSAARIERSCEAAGDVLPPVNVDARGA
jgi:hypothetical protein